ncbi:WD repeat-containing protein 26 [Phyllosticta capitalensis]|uniref:WD repeat-containing protein 26 n=1 Tax=Phyllosticta capitalensis TaxID=121624 RepID=UPI00312FD27D
MSPPSSSSAVVLLLISSYLSLALAQQSSDTLTFGATPPGYTFTTYNYKNVSSPRPSNPSEYSNEALAVLWDRVGPITEGPVTSVQEAAPGADTETFPQPGVLHGYVPGYVRSVETAKLPKNFVWGVASSAYQIEGAADAEGKGPSVWDLLSHKGGVVADNTTGDVVSSHYWLYKQDIARLKALGIPAFTPSFSWPRFFPFGRGPVNEEAVRHYDDVVREMVRAGISLHVALFHWDMPLSLFLEYGAWVDRRVIDDFFNYAKFVISRYDRYVDTWYTFNEPQYCNWQFSVYPRGDLLPVFNGYGEGTNTRFICSHLTILAHAKVAKWYKEEFKGRGRITFKNSGNYGEANSTSEGDRIAVQRSQDFTLGVFGGPWTDGDYPQSVKDSLGDLLPTLTQEEKDMIKGSCDFFAIDGYSSYTAYELPGGFEACQSNRSDPNWPECHGQTSVGPDGFILGPPGDQHVSWLLSTPVGLRRYLNQITKELFPSVKEIVVTEFGFAEPFENDWPRRSPVLWDLRRADYFQSYLDNILAAIVEDGVNVTGAWGWAAVDNYEWFEGTSTRFGLQYVNYTDLTRTPKASMFQFLGWFKEHLSPFDLADETPPHNPNLHAPDSQAESRPEPFSHAALLAPHSLGGAPTTLASPTPLSTQSSPASSTIKRTRSQSPGSLGLSYVTKITSGEASRGPKRRRKNEDTMRLDSESRRSPSPSQAFSNGSNGVSPRRGVGKAANGASSLHTNGNASALSATFFGHDREEVTRILIQGLTDLGYTGAADSLSQESGFQLEGPTVAAFRNAVLQGDWAEAEALLFGTDDGGGYGQTRGKRPEKSEKWSSAEVQGLTLAEGANKDEMRFWMRQQKYLELLEARDLNSALMVLRQELTPLHQDRNRLHALSSLIMCQSAEDLKVQAQWDGAAGESRSRLLSELSRSISPNVMIPERRLAVLLDQVKDHWVANCLYHNTSASPSLYLDHMCEREDFPLAAVLELRHHVDEVWFLRFSNDGSMLATTGRDQRVVVYDTSDYHEKFILKGHEAGVCYIAWSPDDKRLISCSKDNSAKMWDTSSGALVHSLDSGFDYPVTAAAWAPNGETFVTGSQDSNAALCLWTKDCERLHIWKEDSVERDRVVALRVNDVGITPDASRLVALLENHIVVYDFVTREKLREYDMLENKPTSLSISACGKFMLVSMNQNKICLMDIDTGEVRHRYDGQKQVQYIIRSAFGGANENFVVSGSEDSRVYIWRSNGHLVEALEAHRPGCVNCVEWHPRDPTVFASAGDDRTVRM